MSMIRAAVVDEHCNTVGQEIDFQSGVLPNRSDPSYYCLKYVDPYGDTLFNQLQIPMVCADLDLLEKVSSNEETLRLIKKLKSLCEKCLSEPHLYLKFIGD